MKMKFLTPEELFAMPLKTVEDAKAFHVQFTLSQWLSDDWISLPDEKHSEYLGCFRSEAAPYGFDRIGETEAAWDDEAIADIISGISPDKSFQDNMDLIKAAQGYMDNRRKLVPEFSPALHTVVYTLLRDYPGGVDADDSENYDIHTAWELLNWIDYDMMYAAYSTEKDTHDRQAFSVYIDYITVAENYGYKNNMDAIRLIGDQYTTWEKRIKNAALYIIGPDDLDEADAAFSIVKLQPDRFGTAFALSNFRHLVSPELEAEWKQQRFLAYISDSNTLHRWDYPGAYTMMREEFGIFSRENAELLLNALIETLDDKRSASVSLLENLSEELYERLFTAGYYDLLDEYICYTEQAAGILTNSTSKLYIRNEKYRLRIARAQEE